ncbi:ATP-binding protein [Caldilinea sp.]|jgi:ElaB/YqjD/DUF883 family membrane-anchored ribosome-binding protein|uniref:ATP-binding protein n=1 Tax=Caldilinea sp. TaxID=2293560 RepID=UPI0021DF0F09|nr:hypothetical protein [Caldilinea sp.]GIV70325.1 MAG: hypothetical protein KatS3mg048_3187 [Caldilinea sp.]
MQAPPEQLGSFYLGAVYDLETGQRTETPLNYDARDLVTHAVCVGMTGSGKTGLCIDLLEEAAIDRVPALLIDPKGDITNLLLQFPELRPEDFQPWINPDDAHRKGKTVEEFAVATAELWRNGLADWGIGGERMRLLAEHTEYTIFTPGSEMGVPLNIMGSLAAPQLDWTTESEAIRERISGTVAALLGLAGVHVDPVRSREAILLANLFEHFWQQGKDLDLETLVTAITNPPVKKLGAFEVDVFYPAKERFDLAMKFNALLASPKFQSWLQGEPLDVDRLLYTAEGKPRHSILYIAHLSDSERMFIVTLLLENMLTWMRKQSGTTSLRALLYFDEVFGYFPPTAEPPSKRPLLTLLKQARAFGLGVILVTQNPVDIDYKGLTNAGTWFIGKLQAERDKERVLAGLKGALSEAGKSEPTDYSTLITKLGNRVFLMHNVHEDGPVVFHTRWAMSYLRGPLTLPQVRTLMADRLRTTASTGAQGAAAGATSSGALEALQTATLQPQGAPAGFQTTPPAVPPDVTQVYLPCKLEERDAIRVAEQRAGARIEVKGVQLLYEAGVLGAATVRFVDPKRNIDKQTEMALLARGGRQLTGLDWGRAEALPLTASELSTSPASVDERQGPFYASLPEGAATARALSSASRDLADWLYYNSRYDVTVHPELGVTRRPDEDDRSFNIRLQQAARERRDAEVDKLRARMEKEIERVAERLQREQQTLATEQARAQAKQTEQWVNIGESVLSFFMGRRSMRSFSSATNKWSQTQQASMRVDQRKQTIARLEEEKQKLEEMLQAEIDAIVSRWEDVLDDLATETLKPRRTDVNVRAVTLAWAPLWRVIYEVGVREEAITVPAYVEPEN